MAEVAVSAPYVVRFDPGVTSALFHASVIKPLPGWLAAFGRWDFYGLDDAEEWRMWPSDRVVEVRKVAR